MKVKSILVVCIAVCFLFSACSILEQEEPVEIPTLSAPTQTPPPTSAPLVTYTPTDEAKTAATETPVPTEPAEDDSNTAINIDNVGLLSMTVLDEQASLDGVAWMDKTSNELAFLSGNEIDIVSAQSSEVISKQIVPEEYYIYDMSPIGNLIAVTDDMYTIKILTADTLEQIVIIEPDTAIGNAHFSYDGDKLLITSLEEMVAIEADTHTGEILKTHTGFTTAAPVYDASYDRYTGDIIWIARGTAQIQDISTDALSPKFGHEDWINASSISPDGKWIAFSTTKSTDDGYTPGIQVWQTENGEQSYFVPTNNTSQYLYHSLDGSLLFGSDGDQLRFWDAKTGKSLQEFSGHVDGIYKVSLSPDGSAIITSSYDGQTILWQLED